MIVPCWVPGAEGRLELAEFVLDCYGARGKFADHVLAVVVRRGGIHWAVRAHTPATAQDSLYHS